MARDSKTRLSYPRRLFALVLTLSVIAAAFGSAAAVGSKRAGLAKLDMAALPGLKDALRAEARRQARRAAARRSPAGRKARARSRTAFRSQGRSQALRTARRAFPHDVGRKPWRGPDLAPGQSVKRYLDRSTALVDMGARDAVAVASFPMLTQENEKVDMALVERGGALEPDTPLVPLTISRSPRNGAVVGSSGLRIAPAGGTGDSATVVEDKVFYANVDTDTDLIVEPTLTGVETFTQLRSAASPEDPALDLRLPPRTTLRRAGANAQPGSLEVVRGDKRIVLIDPPAAMDADGQPVPVSYELRGERLVLDVPHRARSYRYPILVDPDAHVWEDFRGWPDTNYWESVSYGNWAVGPYGPTPFSHAALGGVNYDAGQWHQFRWPTTAGTAVAQPPYRDSFVFRADTSVDYTPNGTRLLEGFWPDQGWTLAEGWSLGGYTSTLCIRGHCGGMLPDGNPNGSDGNFFFHSLEATVTGQRYGARSHINWAMFYLHEKYAPSVGSTTWQVDGSAHDIGRWVGPNRTLTASTPASDRGLGLRQGQLVWRNGGGQVTPSTGTLEGCYAGVAAHDTTPDYNGGPWHGQTQPGPDQGDRNRRCPLSNTYTWSLSTNSLNEGTNHVGVDAWDIVGRKAAVTNSTFLKVDKTRPTLDPSGPFVENVGQPFGEDDEYDLWIDADDTLSGAESITVEIDGQVVSAASEPCPEGACDHEHLFEFYPANYSTGTHTVTVRAVDGAGNAQAQSWTIEVQRRLTEEVEIPETRSTPLTLAGDGGTLLQQRCVADPSEPSDAVLIVNGAWTGGTQSTEYFEDGAYRVARCGPTGAFVSAQAVQDVEVPGGQLVPLPIGRTRLAADGDVIESAVIYPDPSDPIFVADWQLLGSTLRTSVLAPDTVGGRRPYTAAADEEPEVESSSLPRGCARGPFRTYNGRRWADDGYTYKINTANNPGNTARARARSTSRMIDGQRTWNKTLDRCKNAKKDDWQARYGGTTSNQVNASGDGNNTMGFLARGIRHPDCEAEDIGLACTVSRSRSGKFKETDIMFDGRDRWWTRRSIRGCAGRHDIWRVSTHESGHALGLAHNRKRRSVMYPSGRTCDAKNRALGQPDVQGVRYLY